jgi:protein-tyrosine phosphatase
VDLIDIHSHILYGVDDGAKDLGESLDMAGVAQNDGISIMVATPHVLPGNSSLSKREIVKRVEWLNIDLDKRRFDIIILPGAEYRLDPNLPQALARSELLTINNAKRYVLIELPSSLIPPNTESILYEIQLQGVTPIIAHPERNAYLSKHPEMLSTFTGRGILNQITSSSITGLFGQEVQKTALKIIGNGEAHLLASDGHSTTGRAPLLSKAFQLIERKWGHELAYALCYDNPFRIIEGKPVNALPAQEKPKGWKAFWAR